jgi:RimJ/RimL family protein N-acetyltransferase
VSWQGLARRLEGRRVVLEPLLPDHEDGLWRAARDPEIWRWMTSAAAASREAFAAWTASALAAAQRGTEAPFAVLDARDGSPVGSTRYLSLRPEHGGLEIGYTWYARAAWGTGINVEAKLLLLEHAFEHLGLMRVEFKTDARNERSRRALEALPARYEGIFRKHMRTPSGIRHSAYYSVVDDDWPAVRANLERRLAG